MSSYFDEHNCEPLREGQAPDHFLHLTRLLIDTGNWDQAEFSSLFNDRPPTSKEFIDSLPERLVRDEEEEECPVCLKHFDQDDELKSLPCGHEFHTTCLMPWLNKTSSCPLCRHELPTDDKDYEEMKKQKKRKVQREKDIESLHDSMFG